MMSQRDERQKTSLSSPLTRKSMVMSPSDDDSVLRPIYETELSERKYLPNQWCDTKRMSVLFGAFRSRDANPEGYDIKMDFWINAINKWSHETMNVIISVDRIRSAFERNAIMPQVKCLQMVMTEMKRRNMIIERDQFKRNMNINWTKWGINTFVVRPLSWGVSWFYGTPEVSEEIDAQITKESEFINCQTLKYVCTEIEALAKDLDPKCVRYDFVYAKFNEKSNISEEIFEYAILQLQSEKKLKCTDYDGIKLIKFGRNTFTESDLGMIRLKSAKITLENEIIKMEGEMNAFKDEARAAVRDKNTGKAKIILKKKKRLEKKIIDKENQIDNIDVLIDQIANAHSNQQVMHALQDASEELKMRLMKPNHVETTMADVEDALELAGNINAELNYNIGGVDDEDIENELETLLNDSGDVRTAKRNEEKELHDMLEKLNVPSDSPHAPHDHVKNPPSIAKLLE